MTTPRRRRATFGIEIRVIYTARNQCRCVKYFKTPEKAEAWVERVGGTQAIYARGQHRNPA